MNSHRILVRLFDASSHRILLNFTLTHHRRVNFQFWTLTARALDAPFRKGSGFTCVRHDEFDCLRSDFTSAVSQVCVC